MIKLRPKWQRIAAITSCLLFICCFGLRITADAVFTEFAIAGVAVAGIALLASVTIVAMGSAGLSGPLIDAANSANTTAKAWTAQKIRDFMQTEQEIEQGITDYQINALCNGVSNVKDGTLIVSRYYADWFSRFSDWLIDSNSLSIPSGDDTITIPNDMSSNFGGTFNNINAVKNQSINCTGYGNNITITYSNNSSDVYGGFAVNKSGDVSIFIFASLSSFVCGNNPVYNFTLNNITYYYSSSNVVSTLNPGYVYTPSLSVGDGNINNLARAWTYAVINGYSSTGSTDGLDVWNDDTATDGLVLDPTSLLGDAVNDLAGSVANVGDYIDTLADVIAGIANPALPVVGVGDIPIAPVIPADISIPVTPAIPADIVDSGPVTGEDTTPPYVGTGTYTLDLTSFFPFCIPFDIYRMFILFTSTPAAPEFDLPFQYSDVIDEEIHIDLSPYNTAATILRSVEVIAFCLCLAAGTRKLLFGGG